MERRGFLVNPDPVFFTPAITQVSKEPERYRYACIKNARRFDEDVFIRKMRNNLCRD